MKQPTRILLIANPGLTLESKIALWGLGNGFKLAHSLFINIDKRLDTEGCKQVLDEVKG